MLKWATRTCRQHVVSCHWKKMRRKGAKQKADRNSLWPHLSEEDAAKKKSKQNTGNEEEHRLFHGIFFEATRQRLKCRVKLFGTTPIPLAGQKCCPHRADLTCHSVPRFGFLGSRTRKPSRIPAKCDSGRSISHQRARFALDEGGEPTKRRLERLCVRVRFGGQKEIRKKKKRNPMSPPLRQVFE